MTGSIERAIGFALRDNEASEPALSKQKDARANQTPSSAQPEPSAGLVVPLNPKRRVHVFTNRERYKLLSG